MDQQNKNKSAGQQVTNSNKAKPVGAPMIVERVNKIPMVNFAISVGFSQYDKLKSSNITVGEVMTRAEGWANYFWQKVQPIVEKLQDPIHKADQLACNTFDFVEDKLNTLKIPQSIDAIKRTVLTKSGASN